MGISDKFELVCGDMFDENFLIKEKVDVVVISYVLSTFITKFEDLVTILRQSKKMMKDDGYLFITDFSWVDQPKADFADYGMYTNCKDR